MGQGPGDVSSGVLTSPASTSLSPADVAPLPGAFILGSGTKAGPASPPRRRRPQQPLDDHAVYRTRVIIPQPVGCPAGSGSLTVRLANAPVKTIWLGVRLTCHCLPHVQQRIDRRHAKKDEAPACMRCRGLAWP